MNEFDMEAFAPSFLEDGGGISGGEDSFPPFEQDDTEWDTNAWTQNNMEPDDWSAGSGSSCSPSTPPDSGTHLWGSVDGVCQWIDTTDCSA